MRLLLHICCAPCDLYPLKRLKEVASFEVTGFFYNPNIHPYQEYKKRLDAVREHADKLKLKVIYRDEYNLEEFIRAVVYKEAERCPICYRLRLKATAERAKLDGYDYFSTTLLYSKYQRHEEIKGIGEGLETDYGIKFYYDDFRKGWKEGIKISREMGLYRQKYCGCIYSEMERYLRAVRGEKKDCLI